MKGIVVTCKIEPAFEPKTPGIARKSFVEGGQLECCRERASDGDGWTPSRGRFSSANHDHSGFIISYNDTTPFDVLNDGRFASHTYHRGLKLEYGY